MNKNSQTTPKTKHRFIRLNEVLSRTGYGRTSIYRKMEDGSFPRSIKLGGPPVDPEAFDSRAVAWIENEVEQWIESIIEERDLGSTDVPPRQNIVR
jgi:prophage regulatory protein